MSVKVNEYLHSHDLAFEGRYVSGAGKTLIPANTQDYYRFRQNDNVSHFICRLAYCRNEELRKWFLTQETRLFQLRLKESAIEEVMDYLKKSLNMNYDKVKETDPEWMDEDTRECITFNYDDKEPAKANSFLRVPFKEALALVARRQVYIEKGIAFVPIKELTSIASAHFRARLAQELVKAFRFLPAIIKDARLNTMLMGLSNHNAIDFNIFEAKAPTGEDKIRLSDLDFYSRKSFPPCMKTLMTALKNQHHLKHFGRLQMTLFLKGIGLTMEESL